MAQGDTILIKDLPQEVVSSVGEASAVPAVEVSATEKEDPAPSPAVPGEPAPAEDAASAEAMLGAPAENPFDAVYRELRGQHSRNILEHAERELIVRALAESDGKQVKAAEILGMTRATLRKRIDQHDLRR